MATVCPSYQHSPSPKEKKEQGFALHNVPFATEQKESMREIPKASRTPFTCLLKLAAAYSNVQLNCNYKHYNFSCFILLND
jgi:hypothetical protein